MEEIKITATIEPAALRFRLTVDRPVYANSSIYFSKKENAKGVPLAEKIFQIPEVKGVRISGNEVGVQFSQNQDWKTRAREVAQLVRQQLTSGKPAVPADFKFASLPDEQLRETVQKIFEEQINPAVAQHGGFVELVDVKEGRVYLKMGGGCQGCASSLMTLKMGIESAIREQVPEVLDIVDVTDHAAGANPYY